ncbi:hypothetical protein KKE60_07125 [Patescibacteria group bacterium]|nr:hypothetical protein [Patescibacteria group bacterium]
MSEEKKVTINITSRGEQEQKVLTPEEALEELKRQQADGKWIFVNGQERSVDDLEIKDILDAEIDSMYSIEGG